MNQELFDRFVKCTVDILFVDPSRVTYEASFLNDLDADSLAVVELVMALEEEFDIQVAESEIENIGTVGKAFDLICSKVN
jgi:acyl carrier protein